MTHNLRLYVFANILIALMLLFSCADKDIFSPTEQFFKEQDLIDQYILDNELTVDIDDYYFLRYLVNSSGDSLQAEDYDSVTVNYSIKLLGGSTTVIEESNIKIKVDDQIPGIRILISKIKQGGKITMFIPSVYAYEQSGFGSIPGNTPIILEMELLQVHHLSELEQFEYDQSLISAYLEENEVTVEKDSITGLFYTIVKNGVGDSPLSTSTVDVSYTGYLINDPSLDLTTFDSGSRVSFSLTGLIEGWKILMPYSKIGGTIRMYLPSKYGYKTSRVGDIPSNGVLIFDVTLFSFK